ncbi:MAG: LLM class F420-dependent oxidoreductase [Candidatus Binatia bacterium]
MQFGMMMLTGGRFGGGSEAMEAVRAVAQRAEALGFHALWIPDHVIFPSTIKSRYPYNETGQLPIPTDINLMDPIPVLSFLAGVTQKIRLGTWVLVMPLRNPIVTAKMFATVDVLSQGRITLGAGIGWLAEEMEILGSPFNKRSTITDEYLRAMKELWTNPDPQFAGQYTRFSGIKCQPKPIQQPLPVWIGGHSARAMRRVVELGDGWLTAPTSLTAFHESYTALTAAAEKAGRDVKKIPILVCPSSEPTVDSYLEGMKPYRDLGFDSFVVPIGFWRGDRDSMLQVMDEFASKAKM